MDSLPPVINPLSAYDRAEVQLGKRWFAPTLAAWVVFVKNLGATTITAGMVVLATTTDRNTGGVRISGTAGGEFNVAGVRPVGADDLAQNKYGCIIVEGPALGVLVGAGTDVSAAEQGVGTGTTAGKVNLAADTAAGAKGMFAHSQGASASSAVAINIFKSVY